MNRTYSFEDLRAVLRRRRRLVLMVSASVLAAGLAAALLLPDEYTASTAVQMEPRRLTADFLPAQGVSAEDRMRTVKHGILSRPLLERVLRETAFYPELGDDVGGAVERFRRQIEVRLEGEVPGGPPSLLFVVSVRGRDPAKVRAAAELLPRLYEDMIRGVMAVQVRTLRETLDADVQRMSGELAKGEREILAFKQAHADELPENADLNARAAGRLQALLELQQGALMEARARRVALVGALPDGTSSAGMAEVAVDAAQRRLQAAEAAYSADHPDVRRARRELEEATSRRDQALDEYRSSRLHEALRRIDAEVREHQQQIASLRQEIERYDRRGAAAPRWGQELAALTRDYEAIRAKYVSTVARRADAVSAEALLGADGASLFRVLEPAVLPAHPSAPDRTRLILLALVAALAAAIGAATLAEWADGSLRGVEDAGGHGVPVLAAIPRIGRR